METQPDQTPPSVLEEPRMREFIKDREIKPEDYTLLVELTAFDKNDFIECLHNMFNMNREQSARELELCIKTAHTESQRKIFETALEFLRRYDWAISWNMVRVIEDL